MNNCFKLAPLDFPAMMGWLYLESLSQNTCFYHKLLWLENFLSAVGKHLRHCIPTPDHSTGKCFQPHLTHSNRIFFSIHSVGPSILWRNYSQQDMSCLHGKEHHNQSQSAKGTETVVEQDPHICQISRKFHNWLTGKESHRKKVMCPLASLVNQVNLKDLA